MNTSEKSRDIRRLTGKCLCGEVHYAVAGAFRYALNCHCSNCRRTTGSAFKPFAGIERNKLHVTKGGSNLLVFGDGNAHDVHCRFCGSLVFLSPQLPMAVLPFLDGKASSAKWAK